MKRCSTIEQGATMENPLLRAIAGNFQIEMEGLLKAKPEIYGSLTFTVHFQRGNVQHWNVETKESKVKK